MPSFKTRNSTNTGWIDAASSTGFRIRNQSGTSWINKTGNLSGLKVRNADNSNWIEFNTYQITPSITTVNEGGSVTFTVNTSSLPSGAVLYWTNAGTSVASDFTDNQNSGYVIIVDNVGTFTRTLKEDGIAEGSESMILQLRVGSTSGTVVATSSTITIADTSVPVAFATSMTMVRNDIEFVYSGIKTSAVNTSYMEVTVTLDTTNFWSYMPNAQDHLVFAIDPIGDSSVFASNGTRDHCGQILRNGSPLFDQARGFILFKNGNLSAEHWYAGEGFGLFDLGFAFDPASEPIITVRIRGGYRAGPLAENMTIDIFRGTSTAGVLLSSAGVPWGWDWTGIHKFVLGAICLNFQNPNTTGCIESTRLGNSYGATVGISNFNIITV